MKLIRSVNVRTIKKKLYFYELDRDKQIHSNKSTTKYVCNKNDCLITNKVSEWIVRVVLK